MVTSLCGFYVQAEDSSGDTPVIVTESSAPNSEAPSAEPSVEPIVAPSVEPESNVDDSDNEVSTTDTPELIPQTLTSETMSDGVIVQVSGNLPKGITLLAKIVPVSIADVEVLYAYDISLWLGETEYVITKAVTVSFLNVTLPEAESVEAYHIDGAKVEQIDVSSNADTGVATMTAESFSIYAVALAPSAKGKADVTVKYDDTPLWNETVYLLNSSGATVKTATTNFSGVAKFSDIPVGTYTADVRFNEEDFWGKYYIYTGSTSVVISANTSTKAAISLTRTPGFDGGIAYDDAVRSNDTFKHVDIRAKGTIHVNYQVNGAPPMAKTYDIVVSGPKIIIDNVTYDKPAKSDDGLEYRFTRLRVSPSSTVYLECTITATNTKDTTDKSVGTLKTSYSGRDAFKKSIEDCQAKEGLDFTINESEAIAALFYSSSYSWSAATSEANTLAVGDLGTCVVPAGSSGLAKNSAVKVDTSYSNGYHVAGFKNGAKGTWTFSGWDHSNFNITANTDIKGTWTFAEDAKYSVVYVSNSTDCSDTLPELHYVTESHTVKSINDIKFSKAGCTFDGWTTDPKGETPIISAGTVVNAGEDDQTIRYYAKWKANLRKVRYEWSGSIPSGAVPPPEKNRQLRHRVHRRNSWHLCILFF